MSHRPTSDPRRAPTTWWPWWLVAAATVAAGIFAANTLDRSPEAPRPEALPVTATLTPGPTTAPTPVASEVPTAPTAATAAATAETTSDESKPAPAPSVSGSPSSHPDAGTAPGRNLLVARGTGLFEVALDGKTLRSLYGGRVSHARRAPGNEVLILTEGPSPRDTGELRAVSLATGADRQIARLPNVQPCNDAGHFLPVSVQEDDDFLVDAKKGLVCLSLKDRNVNMMDVGLGVHIDLATGKVTSAVTTDIRPCAVDAGTPALGPSCDYPVRDARGCGGPPKHGSTWPPTFCEASRSPSGRWALLQGNMVMGDYIHQDAVVFDRQSGDVFPIVAGPWPKPLREDEVQTIADNGVTRWVIKTADVVGESSFWWLVPSDAFVLDQRVVTPGVGVVEIEGRIVPPW